MRQDGRFADARRLWTNLATVFKNVDSEKEWATKAERAVASLDKTATDKQRLAPVRAALDQAKALRDQGKTDQAEAIWRGLEELYQNDPAATDVLQSIKAERMKK